MAMSVNRHGPPLDGPAPELVQAGFALENADAPLLHRGLNLADLAHTLDLLGRHVIPEDAARTLLGVLLEATATPAEEFPYDPAYGEPYNCRERWFTGRIGDVAGWLHAGRPRREAVRVSLRLYLRGCLAELVEASAALAATIAGRASEHARTWMPDQTYLQHAQPSTFGHYVLSFAYPVLRDGDRLLDAHAWTNVSPGGAGCVNGSRLLADRDRVAGLLGFDGVIEHTRDAMWATDGMVDMLAAAASLVTTQSKLAEDLEIWASNEFDYVTLADGFSRASVLMPQKRNPYALSIIRGASGTLIGRLAGFLAVLKSPSARSDNLIYAYGEVPRALDLSLRTTRLSTGVVRTVTVNGERMWQALEAGFSQATDLAEFVMQTCGVDYRTAYQVVGTAVRRASGAGLRGLDLDGAMLDAAAVECRGAPLGLTGRDLREVLDPRAVVQTRTGLGGAAPSVVEAMARDCTERAGSQRARAADLLASHGAAETALIREAEAVVAGHLPASSPPPGPGAGS